MDYGQTFLANELVEERLGRGAPMSSLGVPRDRYDY